jgi:dihydrolipoamide dehydrogenase
MAESAYDLVVIGGGPGGYVAAIRAAQLGMQTAVVEREDLGGICLNWGCIPTKALLRTAELYHQLHHLDQFGLSAKEISFDAAKVVARSRAVAKQLSNGVAFLLRKHKVTVFDGEGKLAGAGKIAVAKDGKAVADLAATHIIVATGARARSLPGLEPDGKLVWTYKEAMVPPAMPKSLLVVGSGAIGIEFASFYRNMGAEVTVVEVLDRVLPVEDEEVSKELARSFQRRGIEIKTGVKVTAVKAGESSVVVETDAGRLEAEQVLMAVGRQARVKGIGLEALSVALDRGYVKVSPRMETSVKGLYSIGDVAGPPLLAHKAMAEGVIAAEAIAGRSPHPLDYGNVPSCTYCRPQVASIGVRITSPTHGSSPSE